MSCAQQQLSYTSALLQAYCQLPWPGWCRISCVRTKLHEYAHVRATPTLDRTDLVLDLLDQLVYGAPGERRQPQLNVTEY